MAGEAWSRTPRLRRGGTGSKMYYIYILRSRKDNKHYIGYTNNLERRLQDHARGKSASVRHRSPFELVYKEQHLSKEEAVRRERQIKSYKGGEAFKNLISNSSVPIV